MPAHFDLFTVHYGGFRPEMGTPIRTSNGHPRFVKYRIDHALKEVMPDYKTIHMKDQAEFTRLYHAKLDTVGPEALASKFRAIATAEGESRLVLLCYENLTKGSEWCHRTLFAQWWTEQTGDEVRELAPPPAPVATLFD